MSRAKIIGTVAVFSPLDLDLTSHGYATPSATTSTGTASLKLNRDPLRSQERGYCVVGRDSVETATNVVAARLMESPHNS